MASLRYFAEERPDLAVVAAGSLLEVVIDRYTVFFPVGRVEFMYLFPASFEEYLGVFGTESVNEAYRTVPVPDYAHQTLLSLFHVLRHAIESAPLEAGKRIRFQFLDTGLMNHAARLQSALIGVKDLNSLYRGRIAEHIVGQELTAWNSRSITPPLFWVREKSGTLRSLHEFIKASRCPVAFRLYSGRIRTNRLITPQGTRYTLLDLPYYLAGKLDDYLDAMLF